ncbi:hypothetical protein DM01DRAFT_1382306 [Hesseltinella vesiculosa]|uniref:Uncharacterized protein n=1 Tax=Hesseltinella vesiculosa TaxID=101127 RepID=A0A1X2GLZ7_9FUNG|nr:hypothetical protein DM01DRAFT_1382306 [Hesseltinella vesiculosa]
MALLIYCITFIFMLVLRLMLSGFFCWNVIFWAQFRKMWAILLQAEKNIKSCRPNISQLSQEDNNGKLYETGGVDVATSPTLGSLVPQKNRIRVWFEYFIFTMVYGVPLIHYFIIFALTAYIAVAFFILPKNNAYDRSALGQMIFLLWLVIINPLVGFASHLLRVGDRNQAILQDTRRAAVSTRLDKLLRDLDRLSNLARENTEVAPTAGNRSKGGPEQALKISTLQISLVVAKRLWVNEAVRKQKPSIPLPSHGQP